MPAQKCPNCGAPLSTNSYKCEYCGSLLTTAESSGWIYVSDRMPPNSPAANGSSIYVLACNSGALYYFNVYAAYFDTDSKSWKNHNFEGLMEDSPLITHWMYLPQMGDSRWISVEKRKPSEPDPNSADNDTPYTINVLVCDRSGDNNKYQESVYNAQFSLDPDLPEYWYAYFPEQSAADPDYGTIKVSHWMPLPDRPAA